jgi:DNA helicase-2/ATP-dependent DNA helicase PcrA
MVKLATGSHIFLAFNKSIATELSARGVNGRTFHSLTFSAVTRFKNTRNVNANKLRDIVNTYDGEVQRNYATFLTKLVGLARQAGIGAGLTPNVASEWMALAEHHDLEPDSDRGTVEAGVELAMELLADSNDSDEVDFDDLLYIAVKDGLTLPKFDFVFVDEAQDTNQIQRALIRKIMKPGTRLVAVGDPAQAIYGFRGADSNSLKLIADEFNCTQMPLTVSYRCPRAVVEHARQWVDHIEAAPGAPEGKVESLSGWTNKVFAAGDLVVCRTTKPLVSLAYKLIRDRIACHVMGREIGQGLKSLVNRMRAKGLDALVNKLSDWVNREVERAVAKNDPAKAETVRDKFSCIMCIIEGLDEYSQTVPALLSVIDNLFNESNGGVKLSTIHKAKGLEAARVFWLNSSKCPAPWVKQAWQMDQEENLCYVATTRAKSELILIEEEGAR